MGWIAFAIFFVLSLLYSLPIFLRFCWLCHGHSMTPSMLAIFAPADGMISIAPRYACFDRQYDIYLSGGRVCRHQAVDSTGTDQDAWIR